MKWWCCFDHAETGDLTLSQLQTRAASDFEAARLMSQMTEQKIVEIVIVVSGLAQAKVFCGSNLGGFNVFVTSETCAIEVCSAEIKLSDDGY